MFHPMLKRIGGLSPKMYKEFVRWHLRSTENTISDAYPSCQILLSLKEITDHLTIGDIDFIDWMDYHVDMFHRSGEALLQEWQRFKHQLEKGGFYELVHPQPRQERPIRVWLTTESQRDPKEILMLIRDLVSASGALIEHNHTYKDTAQNRHLFRLAKDTLAMVDFCMAVEKKRGR